MRFVGILNIYTAVTGLVYSTVQTKSGVTYNLCAWGCVHIGFYRGSGVGVRGESVAAGVVGLFSISCPLYISWLIVTIVIYSVYSILRARS